MNSTVFIPLPVHDAAIALLRQSHEVLLGYGPGATPWEEGLSVTRALLLRGVVGASAEEMSKAPFLKVIARHGVGVENIDLAAASERGIAVLNTLNANTAAVAEFTIATMLALVRRIAECDSLVRNNGFSQRDTMLGINLEGKRLGLVGYGRISRKVGKMAGAAFQMRVSAYDPFVPDAEFAANDVSRVPELSELLQNSDVVSVHAPLSKSTKSLIDADGLSHMHENAYLLQVSRGGVVDELALIDALREERIRGAAIDVFEQEPPSPDNPLFQLKNVVLTPHSGALTEESFRNMGVHAAQGIIDVLAGRPPSTAAVLNP